MMGFACDFRTDVCFEVKLFCGQMKTRGTVHAIGIE